MENYTIAENFSLLSKLMDVHGENSFKSKTFAIAAFTIDKLPLQLKDMPQHEIVLQRGIGESVAKKINQLLETSQLDDLIALLEKTPPTILEMLKLKGLGPKKINLIWKEMGIESLGELLYACHENRLLLFKGFGEKTQKNIQEAIELYQSNKGRFLFAEVDAVFLLINSYLEKIFSAEKVSVTGTFKSQDPIIDELQFVILATNDEIKPKFQTVQPPELLEETKDSLLYKLKTGLQLRIFTGNINMGRRLFLTSSSPSFIETFKQKFPAVDLSRCMYKTEEQIFQKAGISFIPSYLRASTTIIEKIIHNPTITTIISSDIKGIIHSHSNWSDGVNKIEEMAEALKKSRFEYLVISDHSKAAFYANGLSEERILEQHQYIDELNKKLSPFKIFKSIECDILNDGSLDYSNSILSTFDLVIASIHSNLKMNEEKAMARLQGALSNPYVTILGHMTGRLLLSRNGYPVDHKKIIDLCAQNKIVIELNANPRRLDIDWQYIEYALEKNVMISINPDAHSIEGCQDIKYGVLVAQKAGLTKEQNLSSYSLQQFENFLSERRKQFNL